MNNMAAHPFTNPKMLWKVHSVHQDIYEMFMEISLRINRALTPFDILMHPTANGTPTITADLLTTIRNDVINKDIHTIQLNSYGVYNKIQCAVMSKILEFVKAARAAGIDLDNTTPKPLDIQKLGGLAFHSSTALAIKHMWIYFVMPTGTAASNAWYMGNVSVTSPVRHYFSRQLQMEGVDLFYANRVTFELAAELNMNPIDINTTMWILGQTEQPKPTVSFERARNIMSVQSLLPSQAWLNWRAQQ